MENASIDKVNKFAPPQAHLADVATDEDAGEPAGRGRRLSASFLDGVLLMLVYTLAAWLTPWSPLRAGASQLSLAHAVNVLVFMLIYSLLNGYTLQTRGQTLGKLMMGIRIVRTDGSQATLGRSLGLRYLVNNLLVALPYIGFVYLLADLLAIFGGTRQCLHDRLADTIVVKV